MLKTSPLFNFAHSSGQNYWLLHPVFKDKVLNSVLKKRVCMANVLTKPQAHFSTTLIKNMSLNDVFFELPVEINFYQDVVMPIHLNKTHVVGLTTLYFELANHSFDKPGQYNLRFPLKGKIPFNGFFELQLFDHLDNSTSCSFKVLEK